MNKLLLLSLLTLPLSISAEPDFSMVGFAAQGGVTGGTGGKEVFAVSLSQLEKLVKDKSDFNDASPLVIKFDKKISGSKEIKVDNIQNVTFLGVGSNGELDSCGLNFVRCKNIIVQNLTIHHTKAPIDGIGIDNSSNIWIDHCDIYNFKNDCNGDGKIDTTGDVVGGDVDWYDGLVDVKFNCENITVSWNYFHDSFKACLNGGGDKDSLKRSITFHHNYFKNIWERTPSIRHNVGHIFNNYFLDIEHSGVNARMGCKLLVENNVFERVGSAFIDAKTGIEWGPIGAYYSATKGLYNVKNNEYVDCKGNQPKESESTCDYVPPYAYSNVLHPVNEVKSIVTQYVGVGKIQTSVNPKKYIKPTYSRNTKNSEDLIYTINGVKILNNVRKNAIANGVFIIRNKQGIVKSVSNPL